MRRIRFHSAALLAIYLIVGLAIAWYGATVPPYVGDLARLGGYSERNFGWRAPQTHFDPPLYAAHQFRGDADVLVIGDSMSLHRPGEQTDPGSYWENDLVQATGWRVSALHRNSWLLKDIFSLPQYRAHPPRLLILEFAERALSELGRITADYEGQPDCRMAPDAGSPPLLPQLNPLSDQPQPRMPAPAVVQRIDFSIGAHHLKQRVIDRLLPQWSQARHFMLRRGGLFSNRRDRELLVYADDLRKLQLPARRLVEERCALHALQTAVEAGGRTRFMLLVVPDKLSVYSPDVVDLPVGYPQLIPVLAENADLHMPRLDRVFSAAEAAGTQDLFLPNDSHPGVAGHRLISAAVLRYLTASGWVDGAGHGAADGR